MRSVQVDLGNNSYKILVESGLLGKTGALLKEMGLPYIIEADHLDPKYQSEAEVNTRLEG